jgi:hypothetical protein
MWNDPDFLAFVITLGVMSAITLVLWLTLRIAGPGPLDRDGPGARARRDPTLGFRDPYR